MRLLILCAACLALQGCALNREAQPPIPVFVSASGDTALDRAMHYQVEKRIAATNGLVLGSPGPPRQITVGFERNVRVVGLKTKEMAQYRVVYFRDGQTLGRRDGTCDIDDLDACAEQIRLDVLEYTHPR